MKLLKLKRNLETAAVIAATVMGVFCSLEPAAAQQPILHYRMFQGSGQGLPTVPNEAGVPGLADPNTRLSSDIPTTGVPSSAGNRGLNGNGLGGVTSGATSELLNSAIAANGGFTMETWFQWNGGGTVNSLIDYAGTEKLVIDTREGMGDELRMRISGDSGFDSTIGQVTPDTWHYVAAVFDTGGNSVDGGAISGQFDFYLDGIHAGTTDVLTISDFGDSLDRPIGVGKHPLGFEADNFAGLLFEPRVTLGALGPSELLYVVPEPSAFGVPTLVSLLVGLRGRKRGKAAIRPAI